MNGEAEQKGGFSGSGDIRFVLFCVRKTARILLDGRILQRVF